MENAATERAKEVRKSLGCRGKQTEDSKKMLNGRNKAENLLKRNELAFSRAQNGPVFERKKALSKRKIRPQNCDL
jgi:hypothetical protein